MLVLQRHLCQVEGWPMAGRSKVGLHASYLYVANSLMDMYAKCRDAEGASNVFIGISDKDLISWNTMLFGFAINGWANEALGSGDEVTFAGLQPPWPSGAREDLV